MSLQHNKKALSGVGKLPRRWLPDSQFIALLLQPSRLRVHAADAPRLPPPATRSQADKTAQAAAATPPVPTPFSCAVFFMDYRDSDLFHILYDTIRQHNAIVLGLAPAEAPPVRLRLQRTVCFP